jgi:hypothetical protein
MAPERRWRRRDAVIGGVVIAATAATPGAARGQPSGESLRGEDAAVLERLLALERTLAVAYEFAVSSGVLEAEVEAAAELFAGHEREHAEALASALSEIGGTPRRAPEPEEIEGLTELESQPALLEFLADREREAIALYEEAAMRLTAPDLLTTGAQILGGEAQHLVVLRQQLGEEPMPDTFWAEAAGETTTAPDG